MRYHHDHYYHHASNLNDTRPLRPWDFPGKSTGVGCHCLLQYVSTHPYIFNLSVSYVLDMLRIFFSFDLRVSPQTSEVIPFILVAIFGVLFYGLLLICSCYFFFNFQSLPMLINFASFLNSFFFFLLLFYFLLDYNCFTMLC